MMKGLLTILIVLSLEIFSCNGQEKVRIFESLTMDSGVLSRELKYSLILPSGYYISDTYYPVVYLLHGLGDDETSWLEYGRIAQVAEKLEKEGQIDPMIYVMPQGFRNYYVNDFAGTFLYQDMFINELIPFIDSTYRTIKTGNCRAAMGYSMGGYGALTLPLKYPEIIQISVPLSISIRTDEQYMYEDPPEWNNQWGRLFGAIDSVGESRLTDYYKENNPLHMLKNMDSSTMIIPKIYIDNGDDEQTLSYSNEALHVLMRNKNIPHEFRVRDGGHSFYYWREALPNALRFISDGMNEMPYRGDKMTESGTDLKSSTEFVEFNFLNEKVEIFLPEEYTISTRLYPIIYIFGDISKEEKLWLSGLAENLIASGDLPPLLLAFTGKASVDLSYAAMDRLETTFRVRKHYRFRSIMGIADGGEEVIKRTLEPLTYTSSILIDAKPATHLFDSLINNVDMNKLERTWFYVVYPDKGKYYAGNSRIHTEFRRLDIFHEFRVCGGFGGFEWRKQAYSEALKFVANKTHR